MEYGLRGESTASLAKNHAKYRSVFCAFPHPSALGPPKSGFSSLGSSQVEAKTQRYGRAKGQTKIPDECWPSEVFCSQRLVIIRVGGRMSS